jgi:uncharacterized DUF497 family protein
MRLVLEITFSGFEWDSAKEQLNIEKHGIGFDEALVALSQPHIEQRSDREGESRILAICSSFGRTITIIYTMRDEKCRIISARAARYYEEDKYRDHFPGGSA